jgi:hypothetical protein
VREISQTSLEIDAESAREASNVQPGVDTIHTCTIARVLKPNGRFVMYDVTQYTEGPIFSPYLPLLIPIQAIS